MKKREIKGFFTVLILILVEVALGEQVEQNDMALVIKGLNPYFSGSCSWRI